MGIKIKLNDLVVEMQCQTDELAAYFNKKTGDFVGISDYQFSIAENGEAYNDCAEWERELIEIAKDILNSQDYILLPSKFEIHDYRIMERFADSLDNPDQQVQVNQALGGKGAFRYFKDTVHRLGIVQDWYKFKEDSYKEIAKEWCEENDLEYIDE
jgi:hypothetical protein